MTESDHSHDNDNHNDNSIVLEGWAKSTFQAAGFERDVYRRGTGPGVVIIHEIPGITPKVTAFANEVVAAGFTVVMPSLVGEPGRDISNGYVFQSMAKVQFVHIPYKGGAAAVIDVIGGQAHLVFDQVSASGPFIKTGRGAGGQASDGAVLV